LKGPKLKTFHAAQKAFNLVVQPGHLLVLRSLADSAPCLLLLTSSELTIHSITDYVISLVKQKPAHTSCLAYRRALNIVEQKIYKKDLQ